MIDSDYLLPRAQNNLGDRPYIWEIIKVRLSGKAHPQGEKDHSMG